MIRIDAVRINDFGGSDDVKESVRAAALHTLSALAQVVVAAAAAAACEHESGNFELRTTVSARGGGGGGGGAPARG